MRDALSRLVEFLGKPWEVVRGPRGVQLCKGDNVYMTGRSRGRLFSGFAAKRRPFGPAADAWFGVPEALDSSSEEELLLKLEIAEARRS